MIGFITTAETASTALDVIREAQESRGNFYYWTTGSSVIYSGEHAGKAFIPAGDDLLSTPLRNGLTPRDFPEFDQLVSLLGGLDARVEVASESLINPDLPTE